MKNIFLLFLLFSFTLYACSDDNEPTNSDNQKEILGAGSTFGYPIYSKMFSVYYDSTHIETNYQSIGSGGGIRQLFSKTVDFGATDMFLSDEKLEKAPADIIQFPTCMGAVVLSYNLPSVKKLKLDANTIGGIFMGKITKWNDPQIQALNKNIKLPNLPIVLVHRSDGSGTTFIFTDYLSKVYPTWKEKVGSGTSVNWPVGIGGKGNEGVAAQVQYTPGSIGFVELIFAATNKMQYADVKNAAGNYITPTLASIEAAAEIELPKDSRVSITNSTKADAYPISSFTWIILYKEQFYKNRSFEKAQNLVNLMWWTIHEGQKYCEYLHYAKLSDKAIKVSEEILQSVTYKGKPILDIEKKAE